MFRQNRAQRLWRLGAFSRRLWNSPASGLPGIGEPGWRAEKAAQVRTSLPTSRTAPPPKATARQPLQSSVLFLIRRGRAFQCKLSGYGAMFSSLFRQELRNKRHPPAFWAPSCSEPTTPSPTPTPVCPPGGAAVGLRSGVRARRPGRLALVCSPLGAAGEGAAVNLPAVQRA